eukprot:3749525-Alexandrium_andersonii.AAC.1
MRSLLAHGRCRCCICNVLVILRTVFLAALVCSTVHRRSERVFLCPVFGTRAAHRAMRHTDAFLASRHACCTPADVRGGVRVVREACVNA